MKENKIITYVGFRNGVPVYDVAGSSTESYVITSEDISFSFDTQQRYCVGWHNLETGESFMCDDSAKIDKKYEQCSVCQKKTGFNPAFYHSDSISKQQQKRNQQPHFLYLAYFSPGHCKVGISYQGRGYSRLYEQGAKAAMILHEFPTALIARSHEFKIARCSGVFEAISSTVKQKLLGDTYDANQAEGILRKKLLEIAASTNVTYEHAKFIDLFDKYFLGERLDIKDVISRDKEGSIAGKVVAVIGSILVTEYNNRYYSLNIKKYIGYMLDEEREVIMKAPARQESLFDML